MHTRIETNFSDLREHELRAVEARNSLNTDPYQVLRAKTLALAEELECTEAEAEVMLLAGGCDD